MRIGCLQFAPQVGDVDNNLNRADAVLSRANPEGLDLLVLPELAFSGYNFKSLQDITPFLEPSGSGITSLWARTIALKYNCIVTVGYPEKADVSPKWPTGPEYYNSLIVVNGDGETIANYRKSFLYYTDETWALEGSGFYDGVIPGLGNTSIGICMDINPYKFEAPWHAFEFAFHVLEVESNLVIISMAWMTREEPRLFTRMPNEPDMETLTYWVTRLEPLIRSDNEDEIIVVFCNRSGNEDEAMYAGTSAVIGIHEGEVKVYGLLGRGEKELLVVDTSNSPYAKLVYRPDAGGSGMEAPGKLKRSDNTNRTNNPKSNDNQPSSSGSTRQSEGMDTGNSETSPQDSVRTLQRRAPSSTRCTLPKEEEKMPQKKRHVPSSITIPAAVPDLVKTTSARSPDSATINIPTPSAPSPTPMAVRPRLIIPESPPILPYQYPPDHPMSAASLKSEKSERSVRSIRPRLIIPESPPILPYQYPADHPISAASLRSERSVRSLQSNFSDASGTTVRSNPRPPEESTPYPDSANPLSGYPSNAFQSERRLYDGHMTMAGPDDGVTPSFSFDEMSPTSPRRFWRPSETPLRTPLSAGWTPGTVIGRKPEPFPWPEIIKNDTQILGAKTDKEGYKKALSPNELKPAAPHSPPSNASSNRTNRTVISESSEESKHTKQKNSKTDESFARPPSPKSRNASRSRMRDRDDSTLEVGEISTTVTQHLEGISRRAESMSRLRSKSANRTPVHSRSPPSKSSRNGSRSRLDSALNNRKEHQMIPVAVSPSILWNEVQHPPRSSSRTGFHSRSQSFNNISAVLHAANDERARTPVANGSAQPTRRRTSRGRAPEPKVAPTNAMYGSVVQSAERASSSDSTRNQVLHSRTRTRDRNSRTRKSSSGQHGRTSSRTVVSPEMAAEFERVEAVVSPSCPLHGRSSSNAARHSDIGLSVNNLQLPARPSPASPSGKSDSAAYALRADSSPRVDLDLMQNIESYYLMGTGAGTAAKPVAEKALQVSTKSDAAEASDSGSLAGTLQTLSTPGRSPATPSSYFNPSTPKAMVLKTDDSDVDYFPNGHLNGVVQADPVRVV
ncbi:hypothetical protein ACHAPT_003334 [Fusarium lateritium]